MTSPEIRSEAAREPRRRISLLRWIWLAGACSLWLPPGAPGGDNRYAASAIPVGLRGDAHAVIRQQNTTFEMLNEQRGYLTVSKVVTIFDKDGRDYGSLDIVYSRFTTIRRLDGWIYDERGEEVRSLEDKDTHDMSEFGNSYSLYTDVRHRTAELYDSRYPYTVAYTYEIEYNGYPYWPGWEAQESDDPVENTRFDVLVPVNEELRRWTNAVAGPPTITVDGGVKRYTWKADHLPRLTEDELAEDVEQRTRVVEIAPSRFTMEGYAGDMSSWKSLGQWGGVLHQGRGVLPPAAVQDIKNMIRSGDSPMERIGKVYRYVQSRTRYVSVQLGIGGWQPFDATYVHERGYGDCKALANYTIALLQEAGLRALPVWIERRSPRSFFVPEFARDQFNHVIVCVPLEKDSVWLECTSKTLPTGHLDKTTENRYALLLDPAGGVLVHTPVSASNDNFQRRCTRVRLTSAGYAEATVRTSYGGDQRDGIRDRLVDAAPSDREHWVLDDLQLQNAELNSFTIGGLDEHELPVSLSLDLTLPRFAAVSGARLFFQPNVTERRTFVPRDVPSRRSPVRFGYPYQDVDTVCISIPAGYTCEALPKAVTLRASFGSYTATTTSAGDSSLVYVRSLEVRAPEIPAEHYGEYRQFFKDIVQADRAQAVLVHKQQ